jgi:MFS family permease
LASTEVRIDSPQQSVEATQVAQVTPRYRAYVLGVLLLAYAVNVMDRSVLSVLLQSIKSEFAASDAQLGLLGGVAFALFYATMGIPIAAWADRSSRRNVLALAVAVWSSMTALCGMAASFSTLLLARIGTAVGEAGGSPPSHSLISDYFPLSKRATALSIYALGVPLGGMMGNFFGGWSNEIYGWRLTFVLIGLPGILVALLVRFTLVEPPRGLADNLSRGAAARTAPPILDVLRFLWSRTSFRHLSFAAALHSFVWYGGSIWNAAFFIRSHGLTSGQAGTWLAALMALGAAGTLLGGYLADRMSARTGDRRWYLWVPAGATLIMVPFQFVSYLEPRLSFAIPAFCAMYVLAAMFFGPSFAMTQALVTVRMRAIAASVLLFVQTLIGLGLGPWCVGLISDALAPVHGQAHSLAYGLVIVGLVNAWAALHYFRGARTLRQDLEATERLA